MAVETITLATAIIGAATGISGTIFGLVNTMHLLNRSKVRLKVIPQHIIPVGEMQNARINFGISVINLSEFPIVLADVGFQLSDGRKATFLTLGGMEPNGPLPLRLEARTSYSKAFWLDRNALDLTLVKHAYARTQCGTISKGMSPALKQIIENGTDNDA